LHAAIGYVTPDDEHEGRGEGHPSETPRRTCPSRPEPHRLPSNRNPLKRTNDRTSVLAGYFQPRLVT
jgi:hypothetical protein